MIRPQVAILLKCGRMAKVWCCNRRGRLMASFSDFPPLEPHQVAESLRARHPEASVLFVSGYTDDAVVRHGILEEQTNFLQKPFTPASLAQMVREILDRVSRGARKR
jgi:DNA-binding NarL/FixJ family response regulator